MRAVAIFLAFAAGVVSPADAAREAWTGTYQCSGGTAGSPYTSRITMFIEDGQARITRESEQIKESMSGRVASDSALKLEGTGVRKETGTKWLYRFEGRIEGNRFEARGAMLAPQLGTRLRECSMSLTRARGEVPAKAPAASAKLAPSAKPQAAAKPEPSAKPEAAARSEASMRPEVAAKPEAPAKPEVSVKPEAIANPEATAKAEATAKPEVRAEDKPASLAGSEALPPVVADSLLPKPAATAGESVERALEPAGKPDKAEAKVDRAAPSRSWTWWRDWRVFVGVVIALFALVFYRYLRWSKRERRLFKSEH